MENIVLDFDGHIQIVDFGFSKKLADGERTRTVCGTLQVCLILLVQFLGILFEVLLIFRRKEKRM